MAFQLQCMEWRLAVHETPGAFKSQCVSGADGGGWACRACGTRCSKCATTGAQTRRTPGRSSSKVPHKPLPKPTRASNCAAKGDVACGSQVCQEQGQRCVVVRMFGVPPRSMQVVTWVLGADARQERMLRTFHPLIYFTSDLVRQPMPLPRW